jgi:hypothetical protein
MRSMSIRQVWLQALAFAATIATTACVCGGEQLNVVISTSGGLTLTADGSTRYLTLPPTHLTEFHITSPAFNVLFNTLEGSTSGEGVAFGVNATDPATNDVVVISLALPVSLRQGDEYTVGTTYMVEATLNQDIRSWGAHDLQQSTKADVAFTAAVYSFPPPAYAPNFRAATSTGTIRVVKREKGRVELLLNLSFTDTAGKTRSVKGVVVANTERVQTQCA